MVPLSCFVSLAAILFLIGTVGLIVRRNAIVAFMCIELMLNACNLAFVSFSRAWGTLDGQIMVFFVMVIAAAEAVIGLALILALFRANRSVELNDASRLSD